MSVSAGITGSYIDRPKPEAKPSDEWVVLGSPAPFVTVACPICEAPPGELCRTLKQDPDDGRLRVVFEGSPGIVHRGRMDKGGGGGE